MTLAREHLDRADDDDTDLRDPRAAFDAFAAIAAGLDNWYATGQLTPRPPGRLRKLQTPDLAALTRAWATPLYRIVFDPDGRPRAMRRSWAVLNAEGATPSLFINSRIACAIRSGNNPGPPRRLTAAGLSPGPRNPSCQRPAQSITSCNPTECTSRPQRDSARLQPGFA